MHPSYHLPSHSVVAPTPACSRPLSAAPDLSNFTINLLQLAFPRLFLPCIAAEEPPFPVRNTMSGEEDPTNPSWLIKGDNAWQLTAASLVGLQSIPGLLVLYAGIVKKKWAINSAFMAFYAFASVLICWVRIRRATRLAQTTSTN